MGTITFESWEQFKAHVFDRYSDFPLAIFRGQRDSEWEIESTLTRCFNNLPGPSDPKNIEKRQLDNFSKKIRGRRGNNPPHLDDSQKWALGQHYGLYTPLIDWTESIYIAAYFAFERPEKPINGFRSIYVINRFEFENKFSVLSHGFELIDPLQDDNDRIIAQAGLLTKIPTGISFEKWLDKYDSSDMLTKLKIPDSERRLILNDLRLMNIDGSTIYPDLHGSAIGCNMWIESMFDNLAHYERKIDAKIQAQELRKFNESKVNSDVSS